MLKNVKESDQDKISKNTRMLVFFENDFQLFLITAQHFGLNLIKNLNLRVLLGISLFDLLLLLTFFAFWFVVLLFL